MKPDEFVVHRLKTGGSLPGRFRAMGSYSSR